MIKVKEMSEPFTFWKFTNLAHMVYSETLFDHTSWLHVIIAQ